MKEFLRKIKLIDNLTTTLQLSRQDFINNLSSITDEVGVGIFSDPFEAFSTSKNEFKGQITHHGFKLKRKKKFFEPNGNTAIAIGNIKEEIGQITIQTEINGFNNFMFVCYGFLIVFYSIFFVGFMFSMLNMPFFVFPLIMLHGALMVFIPYLIMRRSVKKMKYELEREFFYLTKSNY